MKTRDKLIILFVFLAQVLAACGSAEPEAEPTIRPPALTPESVDPATVVQRFFQAYNNGDIEAVMALVADDIKCRGHCYMTGKEEFQSFLQAGIDSGDQIEISDLRVSANKVTFNYKLYKSGSLSATGVDAVMEIDDGKIIYYEIR